MKSVSFDVAAAATTPLVAADADATKFVRVLAVEIYAAAANDALFESASTVKWPAKFAAAGSRLLPLGYRDGWFDCAANEALNLVTSTTGRVTGIVRYTVLP